jgi:hypothetical protein
MKTNKTKHTRGFLSLIIVVFLVGCGKPQDKIIGYWLADVNETKEYNKGDKMFSGENPFAEMALAVLSSMQLEFTESTCTFKMGGKSDVNKYKFVSFEDQTLKLKSEGGRDVAIKILDKNTIVLLKGNDEVEKPSIVLKKIGGK